MIRNRQIDGCKQRFTGSIGKVLLAEQHMLASLNSDSHAQRIDTVHRLAWPIAAMEASAQEERCGGRRKWSRYALRLGPEAPSIRSHSFLGLATAIMDSFDSHAESYCAVRYDAMNSPDEHAKVQESVDLGKRYGDSGKTARLSRPRIVSVANR